MAFDLSEELGAFKGSFNGFYRVLRVLDLGFRV